MSEEITQNMPDSSSFEERVFARFDALDASIRDLDSRIQTLEARAYDTKPIWENALKEIADSRVEMHEGFEKLRSDMEMGTRRVEHKIDILNRNILDMRADQRELEGRVGKLESQPTQ